MGKQSFCFLVSHRHVDNVNWAERMQIRNTAPPKFAALQNASKPERHSRLCAVTLTYVPTSTPDASLILPQIWRGVQGEARPLGAASRGQMPLFPELAAIGEGVRTSASWWREEDAFESIRRDILRLLNLRREYFILRLWKLCLPWKGKLFVKR